MLNNVSIDKIDVSDAFFQSKHINKREEEFKNRRKEIISKLDNDLERIKAAYIHKDWQDDKEKTFLKLFSKLHVDEIFFQSKYKYGYYLLDSNNIKRCSYDLKNDDFWIDYDSIWRAFEKQFDMNYYDILSFVKDMLKKHLKLYNVTSGYARYPDWIR